MINMDIGYFQKREVQKNINVVFLENKMDIFSDK